MCYNNTIVTVGQVHFLGGEMHMMKRFLNDILRANGRVPDTDLEEMRKNQKEARHYIKLSGGGDDDMEDLPNDYFEDEEDLEDDDYYSDDD